MPSAGYISASGSRDHPGPRAGSRAAACAAAALRRGHAPNAIDNPGGRSSEVLPSAAPVLSQSLVKLVALQGHLDAAEVDPA
jgi:hypothetical protein